MRDFQRRHGAKIYVGSMSPTLQQTTGTREAATSPQRSRREAEMNAWAVEGLSLRNDYGFNADNGQTKMPSSSRR